MERKGKGTRTQLCRVFSPPPPPPPRLRWPRPCDVGKSFFCEGLRCHLKEGRKEKGGIAKESDARNKSPSPPPRLREEVVSCLDLLTAKLTGSEECALSYRPNHPIPHSLERYVQTHGGEEEHSAQIENGQVARREGRKTTGILPLPKEKRGRNDSWLDVRRAPISRPPTDRPRDRGREERPSLSFFCPSRGGSREGKRRKQEERGPGGKAREGERRAAAGKVRSYFFFWRRRRSRQRKERGSRGRRKLEMMSGLEGQ